MKQLDTWLFQKIKPEQFVSQAIFFSFIGDMSYFVFLKFTISTLANLKHWMSDYSSLPNMNLILNNPELMHDMWKNFQSIINGLILSVILTNLVGYIFFYHEKISASNT